MTEKTKRVLGKLHHILVWILVILFIAILLFANIIAGNGNGKAKNATEPTTSAVESQALKEPDF